MKKIITLTFVALSTALASVQAITVESGSRYPIVVEVYEWKSVCQKEAESTLSKVGSGVKKAYETGGVFAAFREGLAGSVSDAGCSKVGKAVVLKKKGDAVNLAAGLMIVAYKDPVEAYKKNKKIVNPMPAIKKIPDSGKVLLETRKSSTLKAFIGISGDGGLKATLKK